ncbi:hypothetical protein [Helicobacter suis]|uniref:hypothetical protein n=1 Tax=Helicobacter suis TaxID=104628 RepID=UPI001F072E2F|nr:hypothetical protein [Helicobacter suis]
MIELGFIATSMGTDITLTIERLNDLKTILEVDGTGSSKLCPKIGILGALTQLRSGDVG